MHVATKWLKMGITNLTANGSHHRSFSYAISDDDDTRCC